MKLKTAMYDAAILLALEETAAALEEGGDEAAAADEIKLLTRLGNLVVGEIATEYFPLKTTERVFAKGGEIAYADLGKPFCSLFGVRTTCGASVPVHRYHDRMTVPREGEYDVEYGFLPGELAPGDELPFTGEIGARVVGYGIACEYCIVSGRTDEAVTWDARYRNALAAAREVKRDRRLVKRRWM